MAETREESEKRLKEFREKEAEDLTRILSKKYGVPYVDLSRVTIDIDALKILNEKDARRGKLVIFQQIGKKLRAAVRNPELLVTKEVFEILKRQGFTFEVFMASEQSLERAWARYAEVPEFVETKRGFIDISEEKLREFWEQIKNINDLNSLLAPMINTRQQRQVSAVLEVMLAGAVRLESSDIHIEPYEKEAKMRIRIDGILHDVITFSHHVYGLLLSRIKLVSQLTLNVHEKPQDGRFTIRLQNTDMEVRTSVLPGPYGESVVLRILNPATISINFENLGMDDYMMDLISDALKSPNGMILTTGPTGSGKTTTLYAFLRKKFSPDINIITIEDPIEYHIPNITQTQVDPEKGYDFANGLRSILRQDPDVILVGEIRDFETANTAMHAALTGHLVFSTLHTNDAAGTIPRLIDLGVQPSIIAPAVHTSMAQRLVRKLCPVCKKKDKPTLQELKHIEAALSDLPKTIPRPDIKNAFVYRPAGCLECNNLGYKGRIGIFEILTIDEHVEQLILHMPSHEQLKAEIKRQNMPSLLQDGILKILRGITSLEELERVAGTK